MNQHKTSTSSEVREKFASFTQGLSVKAQEVINRLAVSPNKGIQCEKAKKDKGKGKNSGEKDANNKEGGGNNNAEKGALHS